MKQKIESCYGKEVADKFKASNNWFQRFKRRHKISLRRRTNKKKNAANDGRETIQRFHRDLRKAVQSKRRRDMPFVADETYGQWLPKNRLNVDQVPLPFVVEQDQTYEFEGSKQVWISQPGSGLDKRQATLQLCRGRGRAADLFFPQTQMWQFYVGITLANCPFKSSGYTQVLEETEGSFLCTRLSKKWGKTCVIFYQPCML